MPPKADGRGTTPLRLFSFDSGTSSSKPQSSSAATLTDREPWRRGAARAGKTLEQVDERRRDEGSGNNDLWREQMVAHSPRSFGGDDSNSPSGSSTPRFEGARPSSRQGGHKPAPLHFRALSTKSTASEDLPLPSPSNVRWEHVRQHVIPVPPRPTATPTHNQQPSAASSTTSLQPPRSQTPKPSRLARLGFRQVVEHVREIAVDDTRKFGSEIQQACWSARFVVPQKATKGEAHTATMGSYLPFMSNTSLATAGLPSAPASQTDYSNKKHEMRRPQSTQTLSQSYQTIPSLVHLYQTLLQHSRPSMDGFQPISTLPHEAQVLSTLLSPFLTSEQGVRVDEERRFAVEAFETIVKNWGPIDEAGGIERGLWCCNAAAFLPASPLRLRIVNSLRGLFVQEDHRYRISSPQTLQTLIQGVFMLIPSLQSSQQSLDRQTGEDRLVADLISQICNGSCGELDVTILEEEYNAIYLDDDDPHIIANALVLEAFTRCLERSSQSMGQLLLQHCTEDYWATPIEGTSFTPLMSAIHARILATFGRASLTLLGTDYIDASATLVPAKYIIHALQTYVIPEIEIIKGESVFDARLNVVKFVLAALAMDPADELKRWANSMLSRWYLHSPQWKDALHKALQQIITHNDWPDIIQSLTTITATVNGDVRKPLLAHILPILTDQMVEDPPPYPCQPLTHLLEDISHLYPQLFFKPLFICAASSKEFTVVNHLCSITIVSKFLPEYWTRDAEMLSVALMSDIGGAKATITATNLTGHGTTRLGQSILLLELIGHIQGIRHVKEASSSSSDASFVGPIKFVLALEARLAILLEAKERSTLVPPSQRLLFCLLFREIRLLTRSLKAAAWLPKIVDWVVNSYAEDDIGDDSDSEFMTAIDQIQGLYSAAQDGVRSSHKRRSTMLLSSDAEKPMATARHEQYPDISVLLAQKSKLVKSLSKGFIVRSMKLLVAMSALMTYEDFRRLGPHLWYQGLTDDNSSVTASVCFLIMQCAEKTPMELLALMEVDLQSSDDFTKLDAIQKISVLSNWRFQIMSQQIIVDRAHRPFKVARGPLPFVATDMGSSLFVREDDLEDQKGGVPLELRKQLAEIGWADENTSLDQNKDWIRMPMSLLPAHQLDRLESGVSDQTIASPPSPSVSPNPSPSKGDKFDESGLLRRNSSTGGPLHGIKRRAVFVPSLSLIFPRLASMVFDLNFAIASAARTTLLDLMRNDPALLTRPIFDLFAGDSKDMTAAISTLRAFLHVRRVLPPPMAHNVFNNLAGFLKFAARHVEMKETLQDFAYTIPILAKIITQVSGISIREIRRAKVEALLIPSGSLWFPPSAPTGPMFPRSLATNPATFEDLPAQLVAVTMIRLSQNMLFLSMLKRNQQDVQLIRKSMTRLVLPSMDQEGATANLGLGDFVPQRPSFQKTAPDISLRGLSLMLSRSYLLLVAQVFRSMSRQLNDRNELAVLVDGLNRILLAHGNDIGIVSQALIALMVASTRFRRLFTSGGGYTLFMPGVMKVYTEAESHSGIRHAIEYAVNRFYALHREAFVFQSLDIIAHVMMLPNIEADWLAKSVYTLFSTLRKGSGPSTPDAAGIHNSNKLEEREALIVTTAEEKPQTFLASLRRGDAQGMDPVTIDLPDEYESNRLSIDDFVRLFLTIIAHDPTIFRAEQFLHLFRFLTPYLYNASNSARSVLQEGLDALGTVLAKLTNKSKAPDNTSGQSTVNDYSLRPPGATMENRLHEKSRNASDAVSMRLDYLSLIVAFTRAGGQLEPSASYRAIDLAKTLLRESSNDVHDALSTFFDEFTRTSLIRESPPSLKAVIGFLQYLAPVISAYGIAVDFTGVYETVCQLAANPAYASHPAFSKVVVEQICAAGLAACELAASDTLLLTLPCRPTLVKLLAQAVFLRGGDIVPELKRRTLSFDFLAGIVLPLAMSLKTGVDVTSNNARAEPWHQPALASTWIRLLEYSMRACEHSQLGSKMERRRSGEPNSASIPTFLVGLQILKVIIIRAETALTAYLPGVWNRVAWFLKTALAEGSAKFTQQTDQSPLPSPTASPRASGQFDHLVHLSISTKFRSPSLPGRSLVSPRIVDYALWSLLELLCAHRTPLMLQLRLFMMEKVIEVDNDLRYQQSALTLTPVSARSRRISSSVFSKPRRRVSGMHSPESSPKISASPSFPNDDPFSDGRSRQPGYQNFPSSPTTAQDPLAPRIVHLGPISNPSAFPFRRSISPGAGERNMRFMTKTTKIKSLTLVQATYRRIRLIQSCMGYDLLLPLPHGGESVDDEVVITSWTKQQAVEALAKETRELLEEVEVSFRADEDIVMVEAI